MDAPRLLDQRAAKVVEGLHALSEHQVRLGVPAYLLGALLTRLRGGRSDYTETSQGRSFLSDKLVALDREKAALCYLLCRALNARQVVEAGTSFGVSTIYLACAVRDAAKSDGTKGLVIGTEHEPAKAAVARLNFAEAGVSDCIDLREGDLRETLKHLSGPVDFMLVDIWIPMARPALELVRANLRPGAIVVCDNVVQFERQYRDYLNLVRNPENGFQSITLPLKGGVELSMRL